MAAMVKRYGWLLVLLVLQLLSIVLFVMLTLGNMLTLKYEVEGSITNTTALQHLYKMLGAYNWFFVAVISLMLLQNILIFSLLKKQR